MPTRRASERPREALALARIASVAHGAPDDRTDRSVQRECGWPDVRHDPVARESGRVHFIKQIDVVDANTARFALTAPAATFLVNPGGKYNRISPDHTMR